MTHHPEHPDNSLPTEMSDGMPHRGCHVPPTWRERVVFACVRFTSGMNVGVMTVYLGAASLIGFEFLVLVLSFTSLWPVSMPFVVGTLALVYFFRGRLRMIWHGLRRRNRAGREETMGEVGNDRDRR